MRRPLPPLNALRAFEAAARHMSLTRAAEELHVTQGAVSQQVKLLEEYLDTQLFIRRARKLELTDAARAYLPVLSEAFNNLLFSTNELFGSDSQTLLRIKTGTSFADRWLIARLPDFLAKHPEFRVRLHTAAWPSDQQVEEADLEICNGYGNWSGWKVLRLTRERWIVVASPAFLQRQIIPEDPQLLLRLPLIITLGWREGWQNWFAEQGLKNIETAPVLECDTSTMAVDAAIRGVGLLLCRDFSARQALRDGLLVQAHPHTMEAQGGHYLCLPNKAMTPKVSAFCRWLLEGLAAEGQLDSQITSDNAFAALMA